MGLQNKICSKDKTTHETMFNKKEYIIKEIILAYNFCKFDHQLLYVKSGYSVMMVPVLSSDDIFFQLFYSNSSSSTWQCVDRDYGCRCKMKII